VQDDDRRRTLATKCVNEGLSVREAEMLAKLLAAGASIRSSRPVTPKSYKVVARKLRRLLATNVRVRQTAKKGKIEIDFVDEEDLERIVRSLTHRRGVGMRTNRLEAFVIGAIIGTAAGIVVGILFAPAPGIQTRRRLADEANRVADVARRVAERAEHAAETIGSRMDHYLGRDAEIAWRKVHELREGVQRYSRTVMTS